MPHLQQAYVHTAVFGSLGFRTSIRARIPSYVPIYGACVHWLAPTESNHGVSQHIYIYIIYISCGGMGTFNLENQNAHLAEMAWWEHTQRLFRCVENVVLVLGR